MTATDEEFTQVLDVQISNFGKRCRFATPLPAHLKAELKSAGYMDALPSNSAHGNSASTGLRRPASDDTAAATKAATAEANRLVAHQECLAAVTNVADWLKMVRNARSNGEATLQEVNVLADRLHSLCEIAKAVKAQSDHLSANASTLMVRKAKLEHVQESLQHHIRKFTKVEDLVREAEHPLLSAATARFPVLLEEMEDTMQFLSENHQLKSAKPYATKLALAQQRALICLRDAVCASFQEAQTAIANSAVYVAAFRNPANVPLTSTIHGSGDASAGKQGTGGAARHQPHSSTVSQVLSSEGAEEGGEVDKLRALLATLNDTFTKHLDGGPASQRRLVEARCVGLDEDVHLSDILATYRETRGRVLFPIVRDWLEASERAFAAEAGVDNAPTTTARLSLGRFAATVCSFLADTLVEERSLFDTMWLRDDVCMSWDLLALDIGEELYHCFRSRLLQTDDLDDLSCGVDVLRNSATNSAAIAASSEYANLVKRMMQDTQERMVFRVSVYLRSVVGGRRIGADEPKKLIESIMPKQRHSTSDEAAEGDVVETATVVETHGSLEGCLAFLKMLYPAVERSVFGVFADECIHMTLTFLGKLVKQMQALRSASPLAPLLGSLYHLHHLLILREAVTRYEANFTSEVRSLDLTQLVQRKMEIVQSSREARKDIETDMKRVCEETIHTFVADIVAKCRQPQAPETEEAAGGVVERWMRDAEALMSRFVESPSTRSVLLRPIQARVEEALAKGCRDPSPVVASEGTGRTTAAQPPVSNPVETTNAPAESNESLLQPKEEQEAQGAQ